MITGGTEGGMADCPEHLGRYYSTTSPAATGIVGLVAGGLSPFVWNRPPMSPDGATTRRAGAFA